MITTIITIPGASSLIADVGAYSSPVFTEFLPVILVGVGLIAGALIAVAVGMWILQAFSTFIHPRDKFI